MSLGNARSPSPSLPLDAIFGAKAPALRALLQSSAASAWEAHERKGLVGFSTEGSTSSAHTAVGQNPQSLDKDQTAKRQAQRQTAWGLRSAQRHLVHGLHRSLSCCGLGRVPIPGMPGDPSAQLVLDHDNELADLVGLTRCASPWSCPVCAPKVAAARAIVLQPQVTSRLAGGWTAYLVTLTLRHGRADPLPNLLAGLVRAWQRTTSGRKWAELRAVGAPEYVRGLDLTWSDKNGWHPHVHVMLMLPPAHGDGLAAARFLVDRWRQQLGKIGFSSLPGGQDVQRCRDAAAAVAYATTPAAVYEAVGIAMKTARDATAGATAFDLLRAAVARDAPASAVARWCEYVQAVHGRRQTTTSRGLTLSDDAEMLERHASEVEDSMVEVIATLGTKTVAELDRTRRMPALMDAVEAEAGSGSAARMVAGIFLSSLVARDWSLGGPEPLPRPGWRWTPDAIDLRAMAILV